MAQEYRNKKFQRVIIYKKDDVYMMAEIQHDNMSIYNLSDILDELCGVPDLSVSFSYSTNMPSMHDE